MNDKPLTRNIGPSREPADLRTYERGGGYAAARRALTLEPGQVTELVKASGLRGRGGAGFPTGTKWGFVPMGPEAPRPKVLAANADEMEPGTFKDRLLLEGDPHELIEGMIIAAHAIGAELGIIFLRWEYRLAAERLRRAMAEAGAAGYTGESVFGTGRTFTLHLHVSAGRYMCGEETGLLSSLEGKRANPRAKPPYPQVVGLFGKPTIVQNVETLACLPHIVSHGAEWFRALSRTKDGGTKLYGASGKLQRPGLWELPMGTTAREILFTHAAGLRPGLTLRGFLPGGASTDFMTPEHLDVPLDFDAPTKVGSRLGTGTLVVLDDRTCPVGLVHNLERFFAQESCGWCTPCRDGLPWIVKTLAALEAGAGTMDDLELLREQCQLIGPPGRTFCALAPGAIEPLQSALTHFADDFARHVRERRCPWSA